VRAAWWIPFLLLLNCSTQNLPLITPHLLFPYVDEFSQRKKIKQFTSPENSSVSVWLLHSVHKRKIR
jgi:hypothetical protein